MLRILSWSAGVGCDKMHNPDFNLFVSKQQPSPIADFPLSAAVKRKRSPSCDTHTNSPLHTVAKVSISNGDAKQTQAETLEPAAPLIKQEPSSATVLSDSTLVPVMAEGQNADATTQKTSESKLKQMRQTISAQLSLEILLKHKELRLIDQEIAKCQVALEQLRRCSEIPYPGTQSPSVLVSEGKGASLRKSGEQYPAKSPAPWGVTDGPYSRHYAKWLLPDARFDGGEPELAQLQNIMDAAVPARSTRGSFVEASKTLKVRSAIRGGSLQSLPAGYGQPKEKATGPMVLKRKSDNVMVKLVCPDCGRHDFGSAQGFINHCRIGHGRSFASHDAAAEACGERVEYNDNGTIKGAEPVVTPTTGNMHPLIRSAKLLTHASVNTPVSSVVSNPRSGRGKKGNSSKVSPGFSPSTQTPHLSALIQSHGLGLNLHELVTDAKAKVELPESDHEDDEMEIDSPLPMNTGRHPQVAGSKQPMKSAPSKHLTQISNDGVHLGLDSPHEHQDVRHRPQFTSSTRASHADFAHPHVPSPTNESNQAPSLVDDDEDFDPQSPPSSDEIDEAEVDFDVQDDEHGERAVLRGGELSLPQTTCSPAPPTRTPTRRLSVTRKPSGLNGEHKNIGVTSPSPRPEGSDRKRRRIEDS